MCARTFFGICKQQENIADDECKKRELCHATIHLLGEQHAELLRCVSVTGHVLERLLEKHEARPKEALRCSRVRDGLDRYDDVVSKTGVFT